MAVTLASADKALKSVYLDVVATQLDKYTNPLLSKIKYTTDNVYGKEVKQLVMPGINGGIGAGTEDGALPKSIPNNYVQFTSTLKNLYGTIEISDKAIRASQNNAGAFVNLLNAEMESLVKSSKWNFGRMIYGDGSGLLSYITSANGTTLTLESVAAIYEGMLVDVVNQPGNEGNVPTIRGRKVLSVDREAKKIVIDGSAIVMGENIFSDSYIAIQGSDFKEITGLGALSKSYTSTLYGINLEKNSWARSKCIEAPNSFSELAMQKIIDKAEELTNNKFNLILCSNATRRKILKGFTAGKSYIVTEDFGYGFNAINFNGIPIVADRFCDDNVMYLLNTDDFAMHQLCDWQWLEDDKGAILKQVPGKATYTATLVKYAELMCSNPGGQAYVDGLTAISE
ncbi:MAG: phage major capsid protein [Clostridia bacterium]|nr:phage major capsid protein [Clostridia bacterium]